ncbi:MAG: hypothetical protein ACTFAL_07360 [Candidatus Electronema sp. V4]|uniref:hypothetical protein n=1 Tax=Candidatus Electronema sp. V4 TaxID=3454756 RepID=UPI0040554017
MKRILLASCVALNCILPQLSFSKELKWSEVIPIKGTGATNCGKARITNEAWDRCEAWAKEKQRTVIKNVELYNIATETDKGTSWDPKLSCSFHANVKCGYAIENGPKLKLTGLLKPKGETVAGCGELPPPSKEGELIIGKCEDSSAAKKTAAPQQAKAEVKKAAAVTEKTAVAAAAPTQEKAGATPTAAKAKKKTAAIRRSGLIRIKGAGLPSCGKDQLTSAAWGKCEIWAKQKQGLPGRPVIKNVELLDFTTKPQTPVGCSYEAAMKCLYVLGKTKPEDSTVVAVKKTAPKKKAEAPAKEYVDSDGMRWSPLLAIEGSGVTNCGENRIKNEAWDKCEAWTAKKRKPGVRLKPRLKDVELYNIASESDKGTSWAPKQSCTFHATLKCGYKME